jgi:hypothetical protein
MGGVNLIAEVRTQIEEVKTPTVDENARVKSRYFFNLTSDFCNRPYGFFMLSISANNWLRSFTST